MFLKAARHGELDEMRGVSANVMCGQQGYFGTSAFNVYLNINKMKDLDEVAIQEETNEDDLSILSETGECSISNIKLQNNTSIQNTIDLGEDDEYAIDI